MSLDLREKCGLFGVHLFGPPGERRNSPRESSAARSAVTEAERHARAEAAWTVYRGLFALQHRGQESAGIVVSDGEELESRKGPGLLAEVFTPEDLDRLGGHAAVGHVRYSTAGSGRIQNIQPLLNRACNVVRFVITG